MVLHNAVAQPLLYPVAVLAVPVDWPHIPTIACLYPAVGVGRVDWVLN